MDKRLIIHLQKRTLAEYAVLMTVCAVGTFLFAMCFAAFLPDSWLPTGSARLSAILGTWVLLMAYVWWHLRVAARRAGLGVSSTALFHTIQGASVVLAVILVLVARSAARPIFVIITFGAEVAVGAFFVSYLFLAVTLCRRLPWAAVGGLCCAILGLVFSFREVLGLEFSR